MEYFILGLLFVLLLLIGAAVFVMGWRIGKLEALLPVTRQSKEGLAINKACETTNFKNGKKLYTNDDRLELIKSLLSQVEWLKADLETENKMLELEQRQNNELKDLLTK